MRKKYSSVVSIASYSILQPSMESSCRLILVAVLDAAEYVALNFQLLAALDEAFLALPIDVVDVFLSQLIQCIEETGKKK